MLAQVAAEKRKMGTAFGALHAHGRSARTLLTAAARLACVRALRVWCVRATLLEQAGDVRLLQQ
eukprot:1092383-Prymnesium_polylepis.1